MNDILRIMLIVLIALDAIVTIKAGIELFRSKRNKDIATGCDSCKSAPALETLEKGKINSIREFNAKQATQECIKWIRDWFDKNGKDCSAIIGISGGKDSTIVASLCVQALGKDRVIGVLMPNGVQADIEDSKKVCELLGIKNYTVNINDAFAFLQNSVEIGFENAGDKVPVTDQSVINLPPRLRMTTLYYIAQRLNGRVANTCNFSEEYVGYSTRWGDSCGDFAPLSNFTVTEVLAIGDELGLPDYLVHKTPSDGLCGKTDEDNLGVSYAMIDTVIRGVPAEDSETQLAVERISKLHRSTEFKRRPIASFDYYTNYTKIKMTEKIEIKSEL